MNNQLNFSGFEQSLHLNGETFVAKIYEGSEEPPSGFTVVKIGLDATESSLLDWSSSLERARDLVERGFLILWEMDFALMEGSLDDEARFLTFQLNIQHFNETVWPQFAASIFGISLYRGPFLVDMAYLKSLAALFPEESTCFLFLDTTSFKSPTAYFQAVNQEVFGHFLPVLKGPFAERFPWALPALGWGHGKSPLGFCDSSLHTPLNSTKVPIALCLSEGVDPQELHAVVEYLRDRPFRVIPENLLTHEWDGVDDLIVFSSALSARGMRKVQGFCAAGGRVIMYPDDVASLPLLETSPLSSQVSSLKNG